MTRLLLSLILSAISAQSQLIYHGGKVLTPGPTFYNVYYGPWTEADKAIIRTFSIYSGGSAWLAPATAFYDSSGTHVANASKFGGEFSDPGSQGLPIQDTNAFLKVVTNRIDDGTFPLDPNGIYSMMGTGTGYLNFVSGTAFHWGITYNGVVIQLSWSYGGNAASIMPNLSHEIIETITDPQPNSSIEGWRAANGQECADMCASWGYQMFGSVSLLVANYATPSGGCTSGGGVAGGGGGGAGSSCPPCPPGKRRIGNCKCK